MAVEELRFVKQGSMNSGEFHALHCEKMQISLHQGRRKGHQGRHILRNEQYKGKGQSH